MTGRTSLLTLALSKASLLIKGTPKILPKFANIILLASKKKNQNISFANRVDRVIMITGQHISTKYQFINTAITSKLLQTVDFLFIRSEIRRPRSTNTRTALTKGLCTLFTSWNLKLTSKAFYCQQFKHLLCSFKKIGFKHIGFFANVIRSASACALLTWSHCAHIRPNNCT